MSQLYSNLKKKEAWQQRPLNRYNTQERNYLYLRHNREYVEEQRQILSLTKSSK